eukprot:TRINITY_DN16002_c0_g1_i1.p1 TRINITY_DN16002_c0_g1~~TRINITY_DN16002_c0_g1_i1.p1  ORF type:complete len:157 (+),score=26.05 TRINITY_DN16002_c0_g1_i1:132-602(+)
MERRQHHRKVMQELVERSCLFIRPNDAYYMFHQLHTPSGTKEGMKVEKLLNQGRASNLGDLQCLSWDVVKIILSHLTLAQLQRVSGTCIAFRSGAVDVLHTRRRLLLRSITRGASLKKAIDEPAPLHQTIDKTMASLMYHPTFDAFPPDDDDSDWE